ncbi:MAG: CRTAC1 family protein [Gammaproteobacteria bacterium]|nr:CRTAC1 family protein [Gammaproteobacteria bacterium]
MPAGSRGVCYADVDNDGDTDFFLCNPAQGGKLYVNHLNDTSGPEAWRGKFVDRTTEFFGADAAELSGAITASWGDYTGDGFVDLFVAKAFYVDPIDEIDELPSVASGYSGGDLRLFKNNMGTSLRKSLVWGSGSSPLCLAGCWLDLDDDGDLDLVTTRYMSGGLSVLENQGINAAHTDHVMEQVAWTPSVADFGANSITVIDYDHNAHLDLLVTEYTATRKQAWILRNNYGSGYSKSFAAIGFGQEQAWNGAVVADFNLDGQEDFVLLPKSADVVPALFMSTAYSPTPEFEEPWPVIQPTGAPTTAIYADLGYTLGIRDGRTGSGFAADLDGDHAPDLFLGRDMVGDLGQSSGDRCLYRSTGSAGATNHWLQVNLRTRGDSNGSLVGTKVAVVANGKQWHKVVDGGSFRGGQGSNDLLFGLGSETSIDEVKVVFPSGETHLIPEPYVDVDTAITIWEDNMDVLAYARPSSAYELQPGFVDWVFRWKTGTIKGDLRTDQVEVWPYGDPANTIALGWGTPGVSNKVYRENGAWVHELHWSAIQCSDGMRWTFQVSSSAGAGGQVLSATQSANTASVTYCLPENYGQQ